MKKEGFEAKKMKSESWKDLILMENGKKVIVKAGLTENVKSECFRMLKLMKK